MLPPHSPLKADVSILSHQLILVIAVQEPKEIPGGRMFLFSHTSNKRVASERYWASLGRIPILKPIIMDWLSLPGLPIAP